LSCSVVKKRLYNAKGGQTLKQDKSHPGRARCRRGGCNKGRTGEPKKLQAAYLLYQTAVSAEAKTAKTGTRQLKDCKLPT
jgi:hypothetical protein